MFSHVEFIKMNYFTPKLKSAIDSAGPDAHEDAAARIGTKLRLTRAERRLTIQQLAQKAGISAGLLSQIERGKSNPSVKTLLRLKVALGVNFWGLLEEEHAADTDTQPGFATEVDYVRRKENRLRLVVGKSRMVKDLLSPRRDNSLLFMVIALPPGGQSEDVVIGKGEKGGMVIEGKLLLTVGDASFELEEGDSFQFPSSLMHSIRNPSNETTKLLWIMSAIESRI